MEQEQEQEQTLCRLFRIREQFLVVGGGWWVRRFPRSSVPEMFGRSMNAESRACVT
jgi:hypothetical protein